MELEAENWWLDSTSHDFDDKKVSSKNINIFLSKSFFEKKSELFRRNFPEMFKKNLFVCISLHKRTILDLGLSRSPLVLTDVLQRAKGSQEPGGDHTFVVVP